MPVTVNEALDGHAAPDLECLDRDMTRKCPCLRLAAAMRGRPVVTSGSRGADPGLPLAAGLLCSWLGLPTPSRRPVHLRVGVPSVLMEQCARPSRSSTTTAGRHPCRCGGHRYAYCRKSKGGCGQTTYDPPMQDRTCRLVRFGFEGTS